MEKISKEFPNILFLLEGSGEEAGDIWRCFYMNGNDEFQKVELRYPEFNVNEFWNHNYDNKKSYEMELKIRQQNEKKEAAKKEALTNELESVKKSIDELKNREQFLKKQLNS